MLKVTSPGVPDFYQGTELWDLNLVDRTIVVRWISNDAAGCRKSGNATHTPHSFADRTAAELEGQAY